MKNFYLIIIILLIFPLFSTPKTAFAEESKENFSDILNEQLSSIDFSKLNDYLNSNLSEYDINFFSYIKKLISGEYSIEFNNFLTYLSSILLSNFSNIFSIIAGILSIAILYKLVNEFSTFSDEIKSIIFFVSLSAVILLIFSAIFTAIQKVQTTINSLNNLISILSPIFVTVMASGGAGVSSAVFGVTHIYFNTITTSVIILTVFPLIKTIIVLSIVNSISNEIKLDAIIKFINSLIKWILGISFTIFTAFLSIKGITASITDGISLKATKYAISNSIPIIGSYISGGFNLVIASSLLIKNALGVGALLLIILTVISPLIFVITLNLALKLTAGLTELIADKKFFEPIEKISNGISLLTVALLGVAFMAFIMFFTIISTTNSFI
ncbi:MAG: stage III sporulation protein AE [Clostridia bacterium]|nr:stage III sporulation protein AE [Clostridia bacterium]